jgi:hypothetical protein
VRADSSLAPTALQPTALQTAALHQQPCSQHHKIWRNTLRRHTGFPNCGFYLFFAPKIQFSPEQILLTFQDEVESGHINLFRKMLWVPSATSNPL